MTAGVCNVILMGSVTVCDPVGMSVWVGSVTISGSVEGTDVVVYSVVSDVGALMTVARGIGSV